jgi:hypothetical protein
MVKRKHSDQEMDTTTLDPAELQDMKAVARAAIETSANAKIDVKDEEFDGDSSFVAVGGEKEGKKRGVRKDGKEKVK